MITWVLCKPCTITTHRRVRYSLKFIECCPQHASSISLPKTWNSFEMEQHFNNILFPFCLHLNWKKWKQELFVSTKYCIQFFYTTKVVQLKMWMKLEWNCFTGKASQWKTFLTSDALLQHANRAIYQANIWCTSYSFQQKQTLTRKLGMKMGWKWKGIDFCLDHLTNCL